jgi:hypothetical protein
MDDNCNDIDMVLHGSWRIIICRRLCATSNEFDQQECRGRSRRLPAETTRLPNVKSGHIQLM